MSRIVFFVILLCFTCMYISFIVSRNIACNIHSNELVKPDVYVPQHVNACPPVPPCECPNSSANVSCLIPSFDTSVTTQATSATKSLNYSKPKKEIVQFTHLFIAMGRGVHLREWKDRIVTDPNLLHVDVVLGVFDEPVESLQCQEHNRVTCISVQDTSWTVGRNLLAKAAYQREIVINAQYSYWTFADADITLSCWIDDTQNLQISSICFSLYDQFLQKTLLPITCLIEYGPFDHNNNSYMSRIEAFDACFNSFHRDSIPVLLPYRPNLDAVTWWSSQAIFWYRIQCFAPFFASAPVNVFYSNGEHNPYPRNPRDKQEEHRIAIESMGTLASIFPPAPDDQPGQFLAEKIQNIDSNITNHWQQNTQNDGYGLCLREFSTEFTEFMSSI